MLSEETREDFVSSIYDMFANDGTNGRANQIIDMFDNVTEDCIEPPCKVGGKIYELSINGKIVSRRITSFRVDKRGVYCICSFNRYYAIDELGKKFFLDKCSAEKFLKGWQQWHLMKPLNI